LSSCKSSKISGYFKNITRDTILNVNQVNEELKIKRGDVMSIFISSLNKEEDDLYNSKSGPSAATAAAGYQVNDVGEIYLHNIGKVKAEGLTRKQLKLSLEQKLAPYLKDPIAIINFENHHVTVIGEIGRPQVLSMPEEKISIIDLLAQSGTATENTQLSNVLLIRQKENSKEIKHLNLEDNSIFNSSFYYLQPDDIVVVNFDEKKMQREIKRQSYQQVSTLVLQTLTMVLIIYQTFFRK
jgi:polysaccharide export outer membrane protein